MGAFVSKQLMLSMMINERMENRCFVGTVLA